MAIWTYACIAFVIVHLFEVVVPDQQPALDDHRLLEDFAMTLPAKPRFEARRERRQFMRAALASAAGGVLAGCDALSHDERAVRVLGSVETLSRGVPGPGAPLMAQEFAPADIAQVFRPNGTTMPEGEAYASLLRDGFLSWRLRVDGLVDRPGSFTLAQLRAMPSRTQITRHDCVEGWSCIGQWTGVQLSHVLQRVGAKQPKYLERIELVESFTTLGRGRGGYWEDLGYAWYGGI